MKGSDVLAGTIFTSGCEVFLGDGVGTGRTGADGGFGLVVGNVSTDAKRAHWCCIAGNKRASRIAIADAMVAARTVQLRPFRGAGARLAVVSASGTGATVGAGSGTGIGGPSGACSASKATGASGAGCASAVIGASGAVGVSLSIGGAAADNCGNWRGACAQNVSIADNSF